LKDYLLPFYISRSWINRFFYFAEPGPITNNDFLCKHGGSIDLKKRSIFEIVCLGVVPHYWSVINDLVCPVPESVWQLLSEK
jgi:ubiquitin carboxyl-terminal hydrolase 20/33